MKIKVLSFYTPNYELGKRTEEYNRKYCEKNGYDFVVKYNLHNDAHGRHPSWSKLPHILESLDDCDYLMWIDADAFFCNPDIRIEKWIDETKDINCSVDPGDGMGISTRINAGVMIIKNTNWSKSFIKLIAELPHFSVFYNNCDAQLEQGAIRYTLGHMKGVKEHFNVIMDTNFNNNTNDADEYVRNGGFVIHLTNFQGKFSGQDTKAFMSNLKF